MKTKSNGDILTPLGFINFLQPRQKKLFSLGVVRHRGSILASYPAVPGSFLGVSNYFLLLLLFINLRWLGKSRQRLKMLIKPIWYWKKVFFLGPDLEPHLSKTSLRKISIQSDFSDV